MKTFNEYLKLKELEDFDSTTGGSKTITNYINTSEVSGSNPTNYDKNRRRAAQRAAQRNAERNAAGMKGRREGETYTDSSGVKCHSSGAKMPETTSEIGTENDSETLDKA